MPEREIQKKYRREAVASVKIRRTVYDQLLDFTERTGYSQIDIISHAVRQYLASSVECAMIREAKK